MASSSFSASDVQGKGKAKATMPSTDTPLFEWAGVGPQGETFDEEKERNIYPSSKAGAPTLQTLPPNTPKGIKQLTERVHGLVEYLNPDAGNIVPLIVEDLALPEGEDELKLLPDIDYIKPIYKYDITPELKEMMLGKIDRYNRQHAHYLYHHDKIDMRVVWKCSSEMTERDIRWVPEDQRVLFEELHACKYKDLNGARKAHENWGGFYAVIDVAFWHRLEKELAAGWDCWVEPVVQPVEMTEEGEQEMADYHAERAAQHQEKVDAARAEVPASPPGPPKARRLAEGSGSEAALEAFKRLKLTLDQEASDRRE
ncbi:hypothetical protein DM02DRAFT_657608 [Periconia macrospinosa]|uniref:Uncharacterized protein n=1 Tax=Periconia macrospinosa TaxID=97972 RepID=A0A2V1DLJ6_9PLEO|nr:hypothetical protein DM02DRAFT_657608 [Periconia macrospinosa]